MSARFLPDRPHLDQLRRQAKELRDAARAGDPTALGRVRANARDVDPSRLAAAQLVVAREHGFASWPALKAGVAARALGLAERVEAFLYASMAGPVSQAARLLAEDPPIATYDLRTAAVLGEAAQVRRLLGADPGSALRPDRRSGWPPLLGVCSSRWHQVDPGRTAGLREVAGLLLDAGADPNTTVGQRPGQPWYCSTLWAAAGCVDNPPVTALLLERGAVPDGHTVYLAAFHRRHECLRLLLAHGAPVDDTALAAPITTGDVDVVGMLLDAGADPARTIPAEALGEGHPGDTPLHAAVERGCPPGLVELLLARGADPNVPGRDGRSPFQLAVRHGLADLSRLLRRHGARPDATEVDMFLAACRNGDRAAAERQLSRDRVRLDRLPDEDRSVIVHAADLGNLEAVRLMLDLGFPVNARGGDDGITPLHAAAGAGSAQLVRLLIARGADLEARDGRFGATPLPWATVGSRERFGHDPNPDFVATVRALIDAGAVTDGAWIGGKPPSPEVAELLRGYGITGEEGERG